MMIQNGGGGWRNLGPKVGGMWPGTTGLGSYVIAKTFSLSLCKFNIDIPSPSSGNFPSMITIRFFILVDIYCCLFL